MYKQLIKHSGLKLRTGQLTPIFQKQLLGANQWGLAKTREHAVARRLLSNCENRFRNELLNLVRIAQDSDVNKSDLKKISKSVFEEAFSEAYAAGLRAGGLNLSWQLERYISHKSLLYDSTWVEKAAKQELEFWNAFCAQVSSGQMKAPERRFSSEQRVEMYVRTLHGVYEAGRVIGSPAFSLIHWVSSKGRETCGICAYLAACSPWPKELFPTTPGAGLSKCLSKCSCSLRITSTSSGNYHRELSRFPDPVTLKSMWATVARYPGKWHFDAAQQRLLAR